mmetsp:Transcript_66628/g.150482  ORF Transcript_66628/g.150482 Transcript_66628/m.150482 type:complete len:217 (+) Transcript_66628:331-981(+)
MCGASAEGIWWEDVLQTASALLTDQGRSDAPISDIAAKFNVTAKSGCPVLLFWPKGSRLSRPERPTGPIETANEFENWVWSSIKVKCDFRNEHTHPVKLFWISGTQAKQSHTWTIEPGENLRMSAFISHLFIARDTRVQGSNLRKESSLLWHYVKEVNDEENEYAPITIATRPFDLHWECGNWARRGECRRNPRYMTGNCAAACKITLEGGGRSEL